jgi:hypothetical protein
VIHSLVITPSASELFACQKTNPVTPEANAFDECALPVAADVKRRAYLAWRRPFGMKLHLRIRGSSLTVRRAGNPCRDRKGRGAKAPSQISPACQPVLYDLTCYERGSVCRRLVKKPMLPQSGSY